MAGPVDMSASSPPAFAGKDTLDVGFGAAGMSRLSLAERQLSLIDVAILADGKIVLAVEALEDSGDRTLLLVRYDSQGLPDSTFGVDGRVTTAFQANGGSAFALLALADGRLLLAGDAFNGSHTDFALARYQADGSLDTAFGQQGRVMTDFDGRDDRAVGLAVQTDGLIVLAGQALKGSQPDFAVARYLENGTPDSGFNASGKVTVDFRKAGDGAVAVMQQADGKLLVAGRSFNGSRGDDFALVRFNPDGTFDTGFGTGGGVTTNIKGGNDVVMAMAMQADGKIVLVGRSFTGQTASVVVVRYLANGNLDTGFGAAGIVNSSLMEGAGDLVIRPDGKLVVSGWVQGDFALVRLEADGQVDTGFGTNGRVTTGLSGSMERFTHLVLQNDGKMLAAGSRLEASGSSIILARFGWDVTLGSIGEDDPDPVGVSLAALYEPVYVDAEGDVWAGVAISSHTRRIEQGFWQYSTDAGINWYPVGDILPGEALLLDRDTRIRFLPAADYAGQPEALQVHLVDRSGGFGFTTGASRSTVRLDSPEARTAVSVAGSALPVEVLPVNDAPVLTRVEPLTGAQEDQPFTLRYEDILAHSDGRDVDGDSLMFRIVKVLSGELRLDGQNVVEGSTRLAGKGSLIWIPPANLNGTVAVCQVEALDTAQAISSAVTVSVQLTAVNDPPVASRIDTLGGVLEDQVFMVEFATLLAASDARDSDGDAIVFRVAALAEGTLMQAGRVAVPGTNLTATDEPLTWTPPPDKNGQVTGFTLDLWDSLTETVVPVALPVRFQVLPVDDAARVSFTGSPVLVYQEGGRGITPLSGLELSDVDSLQLTGASVVLSRFNGFDRLTVNPGSSGLAWHYDTATGRLQLSGEASLVSYRTVLRSLVYTTSQDVVRPESRGLDIRVDDGSQVSQPGLLDLQIRPSVITGTEGADTLNGTVANDAINGLAGDDWLDGRAGADSLAGGSGNDVYRVDNPGDLIREAATAGQDTVRALVSWVLGANLEDLALLGADPLDGTGNPLNNRLQGNPGNNRLSGLGGQDTLMGGGGADTLTGGSGTDTFLYRSTDDSRLAWPDVIVDFNRNSADRIDLRPMDADSRIEGKQAFSFIGPAAFAAAGQLRYVYDAVSERGTLSADLDGDRLPDIAIELVRVRLMLQSDFLL